MNVGQWKELQGQDWDLTTMIGANPYEFLVTLRFRGIVFFQHGQRVEAILFTTDLWALTPKFSRV